ncbi:MAG: DUF4381 domain-containing protein [Thermodesulfobacteriota bacterium]
MMVNSAQAMDTTYSLNNLRDIVVPDSPPLWPFAPGALLLIGIFFLIVFYGAYLIYYRRKMNRYRRAGLVLIGSAVTVHDVSVILKRVALAAFEREKVASLYGTDWLSFLNGSCIGCEFSGFFKKEPSQKADPKDLDLAARWIRLHKAEYKGVQAG